MASLGQNNISMRDVKNILQEKANDLYTLCRSPRINKWSRYKPVFYKASTSNFVNKSQNAVYGDSGFVVTKVPTVSEPGMIDYIIPPMEIPSACRLGDFRGYSTDVDKPINPTPNIKHNVSPGASGVYNYHVSINITLTLQKIIKELGGTWYLKLFELDREYYKWYPKGSVEIRTNESGTYNLGIDTSITYNNLQSLERVFKEYIFLFSKNPTFNVEIENFQEHYIIGENITGVASVWAQDGSSNVSCEIYNEPEFLRNIMSRQLYVPGMVNNGQQVIKFYQYINRPLTQEEKNEITIRSLELFYGDLESNPFEFTKINGTFKDGDGKTSISFSDDYIELMFFTQPDSFKVNNFIHIRLSFI